MKNEKAHKIKWWQRKSADAIDTATDTNNTTANSDTDTLSKNEDAAMIRQREIQLSQKITVDVALKSAGKNIIAVIQVLRERLRLDLPQAKALADNAPIVIAKNLLKDEAANLEYALRAAGAVVELL